jgi:hypothetical protein
MACVSAAAGTKGSTKPAVVEEITRDLVKAADKLLSLLKRSDFPPKYQARVFHNSGNWNQFVGHLKQLAAITYKKPPRNTDWVKRDCAKLAYLLIIECTNEKPTGTLGGLFQTVAGLLHQFSCPTQDEKIADLKTACDGVLGRVKAGGNIDNEPWR